jgi:hypothetical protein
MADHIVDANKIDERLAHLPDDLRKVAEEFLGLHNCWDTEFEVHNSYCMVMRWENLVDETMSLVRFEYYDKSHFADGYRGESWNLYWIVQDGEMETRKTRIEAKGALRRSADFAEFVRRFAR